MAIVNPFLYLNENSFTVSKKISQQMSQKTNATNSEGKPAKDALSAF